MALVRGTPSIRMEGDESRALALIPEGQLLLSKTQNVASSAGVPTFAMNRRISDDEYLYTLVAGDQSIIFISAGVRVPDLIHTEEVEYPSVKLPTILSGLVYNGIMEERTRTNPDGSTTTYNVVPVYAPTINSAKINKLEMGRQANARLAVAPANTMSEWMDNGPLSRPFSQYVVPHSSMWSGTMKKVVQVIMGLGRAGKDMLRDPNKPRVVTPYMNAIDATGIQVLYDYKFMRTHGIARGADNVLWLVEISAMRGVLAMPLPIFPNSSKLSFLETAFSRGDRDLSAIITDLGCLPTGEMLPTSPTELAKKIASGDVLQLLSAGDLGEFYRLSAYSSSCGWAFSERGNEAHNVGYAYSDDDTDVFQKGFWYQININIGKINRKRQPGDPIAIGSAALVKQQEGYLYSPPIKDSYMALKYYEPLLPGLLSHSAKQTGPGTLKVNCDTVVYVGFMNGALKTARFFRPGDPQYYNVKTDERTPGECLLEGTWTWTETTGYRSLPSLIYTNDIDPRVLLKDGYTTTTLVSNSLGFDPPFFSDFIEAPDWCYIWRSKVYKQTTKSESRNGERRQAMFIVPGLSREAYYYFEGGSFEGGHFGYDRVDYAYIQDPNAGYGWRNAVRIAYLPLPDWGCSSTNCGGKHKERRVVCFGKEDNGYSGPWVVGSGSAECREFADSGEWMMQCQDVLSLCPNVAPRRVPTFLAWDKGKDFWGKWHFYSDTLGDQPWGNITEGQLAYAMTPSPSPVLGMVQSIKAEHSAMGDACVIYTKGFDGEKVVDGYVPDPVNAPDGYPVFIGVNQL